MTHSPATVIQQYLVDTGVGVLGGAAGNWPIHSNGEPNSPDNCITVTDTDGRDDGRGQTDGDTYGPMGFQVRVRATKYSVGWTKADAVQRQMSNGTGSATDAYRRSVAVTDDRGTANYVVQCIVGISNVIPLGKMVPENRLSLFVFNAMVHLVQTD